MWKAEVEVFHVDVDESCAEHKHERSMPNRDENLGLLGVPMED
jgi:hypothetical protein